jgi:hypothetical protein
VIRRDDGGEQEGGSAVWPACSAAAAQAIAQGSRGDTGHGRGGDKDRWMGGLRAPCFF